MRYTLHAYEEDLHDFEPMAIVNNAQSNYTTFRLAPDHAAADGHFPGNPIVPGAALLDETLAALESALGIASQCDAIKSAKFPAPARPGEEVRVRAWRLAGGQLKIECTVSDRSVLLAVVRYGTT